MVVFEKVILVTFVVSITMLMLRSAGTTERRTCSAPKSLQETNEYWSGPPVTTRLGFGRLPDVTVIFRFPPFAVRIEFLVKHSVGRGRASLRTASSVSLVRNDVFH